MHLHQDASQRPHVDGQVIRHSQQDLGGAVEPALDVLVDLRGGRQDILFSLQQRLLSWSATREPTLFKSTMMFSEQSIQVMCPSY